MTQLAVVIGGQGGIGAALVDALEQQGHADRVINLSRQSEPPIDFTDLASVERAASWLAAQPGEIRLVIDATGFLHDGHFTPERSLRDLNAEHMGKAFLINAIGPAIVMQHILPLLVRVPPLALLWEPRHVPFVVQWIVEKERYAVDANNAQYSAIEIPVTHHPAEKCAGALPSATTDCPLEVGMID